MTFIKGRCMVKKDILEEKNRQPVGAGDLEPPPLSEESSTHEDAAGHPRVQELEAQIEAIQAKHEEIMQAQKDQLHRNQADLDNYRKRMDRELEKSKTFMLQKICQDILPVIDSVEAAKKSAETAPDAVKNGLEMTVKLFLDVLGQYGVSKIDAYNQEFDPSVHEAMTTIEHAEIKSGHVVDVIQQGYMMSGRLLRPARVIVAK